MVVHSCNGILQSSEKEHGAATHNTMDGAQKHGGEGKELDREDYTL